MDTKKTKSFIVWAAVVVLAGGRLASAAADSRLVDAVKNRDAAAVRALLAKQVDVNATQPDGATALHWAAQWDDVTTVDLLIRAGAKVDVANDYGVTPLALACENTTSASAQVIERLLAGGANPNAALPTGKSVLMTCALSGNGDGVNALLARGVNVNAKETLKGQTALMWAVSEGHADVVSALLDQGADVNARSQSQFTPLLFAAREGHVALARLLLAWSADINAKAADGNTPLLVATVRGHVDLARFFLDAGADPNADSGGRTALHWVSGKWESPGSVPYAQSVGEWATQIGIAAENGQLELMKALLAHGANPNARMVRQLRGGQQPNNNPPPSDYDRPMSPPFTETGATPFWLATRSGDVAAMRLLVANGADPLVASVDGTTALMAAAGGETGIAAQILGFNTVLPESRRLDAARLVLDLGADLDAKNAQGMTALHATAFYGFDTIAQLLVARGAQLNIRNYLDETPLNIAEGYQAQMEVFRAQKVAEVLKKAGAVARHRPGPPAPYDKLSADYNVALRKLIDRRVALVRQIEALELGPASNEKAGLEKLQADLARVDAELTKYDGDGILQVAPATVAR